MSKINTGDKVICIDACGCWNLTTGKEYTVKEANGDYAIRTEETGGQFYDSDRFELVVEEPKVKITKPTFNVGDKVVCVDVYDSNLLIIGHRYTVKSHMYSQVSLVELDGYSWPQERFVLLEEPKDEDHPLPIFKDGDKIVCIEGHSTDLVVGREYTVKSYKYEMLVLKEVDGVCYFPPYMFELVVEEPNREAAAQSLFKDGDKVICIDSSRCCDLMVGKEYTIKEAGLNTAKTEETGAQTYYSYRFQLKDEPKDEATEIQDKINELSTQLAVILKKKEKIQLEQNYHDTLAKMRSAPGRCKYSWGQYIYIIEHYPYQNLVRVGKSFNAHIAPFNIYFTTPQSVLDMFDSVGQENIIAAIKFESNIGLSDDLK